jgi:hypothetical protein
MSDPVLKAKVGAPEIASRVASLGWQQIRSDLDAHGSAIAEFVLTPSECQGLASTYDHDELFRSRIVMARHGFGRGEYKYWAYPSHVYGKHFIRIFPASRIAGTKSWISQPPRRVGEPAGVQPILFPSVRFRQR